MGDEKKKVNFGKKPLVEVEVFVDITDPENPLVISDDEEAKLDKSNLGANVIRLYSKWEKPGFVHTHVIDMNSYAEKVVGGKVQRFFDVQALIMARIRVLLKEWNLHEFDEDYKLAFEASIDNRKLQILSDGCMNKICQINPPSILTSFYNKVIPVLFVEEGKLLKNLVEGLKE